jgi:AraC-like DNA-binding protein
MAAISPEITTTRIAPTGHELAIAAVIATMRRDPTRALTLNQQAEIAGFSPFHFARLFRDVIGIPPGEYLTALRFERSKYLLLNTDASVTDICYEIGYESLGTFSSRFRQLVGVSPQQFRRFPHILTPDIFARDPNEDRVVDVGTQTLRGTIWLSEPGPPMSVYVGLFPTGIARGFPVAGTFVPVHGEYKIMGVPPGEYTLLAAAIPVNADPIAHLTPGASLRVASSHKRIVIPRHIEPEPYDLTLRKLSLGDPPILISLPALMLEPAELRRREEALGFCPE